MGNSGEMTMQKGRLPRNQKKCQFCEDPAEVDWEWTIDHPTDKHQKMALCGFCAAATWNNPNYTFRWEGGPVTNIKPIEQEEQEEEEKDKVVKLSGFEPKLITGGKEPPTDHGSDWLTPLEVGHVFYVQSKTDPMDFSLGLFRKLKQDNKVVILESPQLPTEVPVVPTRFCNRYLMYQSCGIIEVKTIEKEENDDERHRIQGDDGGSDGAVERSTGEQEGPQDVPPRK